MIFALDQQLDEILGYTPYDPPEKLMEISARYTLSKEQEARLRAIHEEYKSSGCPGTIEELFNFIMIIGSEKMINEKLTYQEWKLGLIEGV